MKLQAGGGGASCHDFASRTDRVFGLGDRGSKLRRPAVPQYSKDNYELDEDGAKAAPGSQRSQDWNAKAFGASGLDDAAFDQERLLEYVWARPWEILQRLASTLSIAFGIWWAWRDRRSEATSETLLTTSLSRKGPKTESGEALRQGLQRMGVFFVKIGQKGQFQSRRSRSRIRL